uniref:DED domain-containing protein n=1 Tax=Oreochromis niloticus TaxID=8128 RepID=A0A669ELA5_ORENI
MAELSEELDTGDLDNVKFLLTCKLSREKLEKTKSFLDIIVELEKLDSVSPERLDVVEECLRNIGRIDLVKKLTTYKNSVGNTSLLVTQNWFKFYVPRQYSIPETIDTHNHSQLMQISISVFQKLLIYVILKLPITNSAVLVLVEIGSRLHKM